MTDAPLTPEQLLQRANQLGDEAVLNTLTVSAPISGSDPDTTGQPENAGALVVTPDPDNLTYAERLLKAGL